MKRCRVLGAQVRRRFHLDEEHLRVRMRSANSRYNLMQVRSNRRHWRPAKAIIGAALDDDDVERSAEQPVEATQQSGRGLPAHTGVHDLEREARRVDLLLNQLGI